jgi:hypothetical protein
MAPKAAKVEDGCVRKIRRCVSRTMRGASPLQRLLQELLRLLLLEH